MTKTPSWKLGFALAILAFSPAANCDGGDRNLDDGTCPAGETCSGDTSQGLLFVGPVIGEGFFDQGEVKVIATGGTESIALETEDSAGAQQAFALAYDAAITGGEASVARIASNRVDTRAAATAGTGYLRITDPADGTLFDRIALATDTIASVALTTSLDEALAARTDGEPMLFAPGGTGLVGLTGAGGSLLVDDSLAITGAGIAQTSWDHFVVGDLAPGMHTLVATSAGTPVTLAFEVAAAPDRLAYALGGTALTTASSSLVCFGAFAGARYIHAPWSFSADGADLAPTRFEGCTTVTPRATETSVVVHARSGTLVAQQAFTVTRGTSSDLVEAAPRGTAGERYTPRTSTARPTNTP